MVMWTGDELLERAVRESAEAEARASREALERVAYQRNAELEVVRGEIERAGGLEGLRAAMHRLVNVLEGWV